MTTNQEGLTPRMRDRIGVLREEFAKDMGSPQSVFHVLVVFRDDLDDVAFGPKSLIREWDKNIRITLPNLDSSEVVGFAGMVVISPPRWTELGRAFRAPTAFRMLPEARKALVAEPGYVAEAFTVVRKFDPVCAARIERFHYLAADAGRILAELRGPLAHRGIVHYQYSSGRGEDEIRWLVSLHRLAWREDPESGLHAVRNTWLVGEQGQVSFFPFDAEEILRLRQIPPLADRMSAISVPPHWYVSVIDQDLFLASVYGLCDVVSLLNFDKSEEQRATRRAAVPSRDTVFISYSRKDEQWLLELVQMLAPVVRDRLIKIWYDQKLKPSDVWRKEIRQELARARVGVLLVTKSFLASKFIQDEELAYFVEAARKDSVPLLWIAVDHSMYEHTPLQEMQAVNDPEKPWSSCRGAKRQLAIKKACTEIVRAYGLPDASGPNT